MMMTKKIKIIVLFIAVTSLITLMKTTQVTTTSNQNDLIELTINELSEFNGTDPKKPIYIVMDNLIYDVTKGEKYYKTGGAYHDLAGKDSTKDLNIAGGSIIKRKYPVIGKIVE